jgi:hypothetical protein
MGKACGYNRLNDTFCTKFETTEYNRHQSLSWEADRIELAV